jgi:signal transduction histidine kinase
MVCHRIITDHSGTIEVRSGDGEGTTFTVRLPVQAGEGGAGASA